MQAFRIPSRNRALALEQLATRRRSVRFQRFADLGCLDTVALRERRVVHIQARSLLIRGQCLLAICCCEQLLGRSSQRRRLFPCLALGQQCLVRRCQGAQQRLAQLLALQCQSPAQRCDYSALLRLLRLPLVQQQRAPECRDGCRVVPVAHRRQPISVVALRECPRLVARRHI